MNTFVVEFSYCGKRHVGKVLQFNSTTARNVKVQWHDEVGKHINWFKHSEVAVQ